MYESANNRGTRRFGELIADGNTDDSEGAQSHAGGC